MNEKPKLTEAAKQSRAAYKRQWNAAHPDKNKEYQRRYWERQSVINAAMAKMFADRRMNGEIQYFDHSPEAEKKLFEKLGHYIEVEARSRGMNPDEIKLIMNKAERCITYR